MGATTYFDIGSTTYFLATKRGTKNTNPISKGVCAFVPLCGKRVGMYQSSGGPRLTGTGRVNKST